MSRPPKLDEVAREAGVSTATVSRVLNAPETVREATREAVMRVVERLGYTPNFGARALASNRTGIVGAVIPTMRNAIFAQGLQAVEDRLAQAGLTLVVATSGYDPAREAAQVRTLIGRGAEALILIGQARDASVAKMLAARNVPALAVWTCVPGPLPAIGFDNRAAAAMIAGEVRERGHREVAMIAGRLEGNDRAVARKAGVEDVFGPLPPGRLVEAAYDLEAGREAAVALLAAQPAVTALICGNDVLAAGALAGVRVAGLDCPGDISVTGFDDLDLARAVSPSLTTVAVPHREMGTRAAEALLAALEGEVGLESVELPARLVLRDSLAPPR